MFLMFTGLQVTSVILSSTDFSAPVNSENVLNAFSFSIACITVIPDYIDSN